MDNGHIDIARSASVATLTFAHPKGNSLPRPLLKELCGSIEMLGKDPTTRVIVLASAGEKVFCAGASFDEFKAVRDLAEAQEFFQGIARVVLAMRRCPKPIVARVQGKVVGGGAGLVAAADYVVAHSSAALRLSELAIGLGPFLIGPAVERKVGRGAFQAMAWDADWRTAEWLERHSLYNRVCQSVPELDSTVASIATRFSEYHEAAVLELKRVLWEETEHWDDLVPLRANISAKLVLSDFVQQLVRKEG